MVIHLQRDEGKQQAVGGQKPPRRARQPAAREHPGGEQCGRAHEAVAEDVHGIQERVEGHEQKHLNAFNLSARETGRDQGELNIVDQADEDGVDGREGDGGVAPDFPVGGGELVDADGQDEKGGRQQERGRQQDDDAEGRAAALGAALRPQQARPFGKLCDDVEEAEGRGKYGGPEPDCFDGWRNPSDHRFLRFIRFLLAIYPIRCFYST